MAAGNLWNWQQNDWPQFSYDRAQLEPLEADFLRLSGISIGSIKHAGDEDKRVLTIDWMSDEAVNTSKIEGEILDRESVQSSIRRHFGLATDHRQVPAAEQGIGEMMVDLYRNFEAPLSDETLFRWHRMLMSGRRDIKEVGSYRTDATPMQIVSGPLAAPKVHFEAPPSSRVSGEMKMFIEWFNRTSSKGELPLPILTRAGIAHLYFESIHPFEDGNGRVGRAIAEMAFSQGLGQSTLIPLSHTINEQRKAYYQMLEDGSKGNEITRWLTHFARTVLAAQRHTQRMIDFLIAKTRFFDGLRGQLNPRQEKVIARMFREGPNGFKGGLSAANYIRITDTSRATATRDLQDLVEKKALFQTGDLKSTRYHLRLDEKV